MSEAFYEISNFIDGKACAPASGNFLDLINPATAKVFGKLPDSDAHDVQAAILAAEKAHPAWASTPPRERAQILRKISQGIMTRLEELARAESLDSGKPLKLARELDIPRSAYNFEFFADAITQWASEAHPNLESASINYTLHQPLGVVACISPWNLPLYLFSWKIAPALAAGNCVVGKPSEMTPLSASILAEIAYTAGLPPGVLNLVHGQGAKLGETLCTHPSIRAISFTGSTATGARIAAMAAPYFKKVSLEMGGKNATLVFADADFERCVATVARSAFLNQGQICLCGSRILIEESIYDRFVAALLLEVKKLKCGDPLLESTTQGAMVSQLHLDKVMSYIEIAKKEGARILCGGTRAIIKGPHQDGFFIEPTLLEGLGPDSRCNQEEIFGPVATLQKFKGDEQALELANNSRYGLATSIWTRDLKRAHRFSQLLESGIVWVNTWMQRDLRTPFGGSKDSGLGREGGIEALRFFTETKNVCIKYD